MFERLLIDAAAIATIFQIIFDVWKFFWSRSRKRKAGDAREIK